MRLLFHPAQACTVGLRNKENQSELDGEILISSMTEVFKGAGVGNLFVFISFHRQKQSILQVSLISFYVKCSVLEHGVGKELLCCDKTILLPASLLLKKALLAVVWWCCLLHFSGAG